MKLILRYLKRYKLLFFFNVLSVFGFILVELGIPTIVATMIDTGVANKDVNFIYMMGGCIALVSFIGVGGTIALGYCCAKISTAITHDIRNDIFIKAQQFTASEFNKIGISSMITRTNNDALNANYDEIKIEYLDETKLLLSANSENSSSKDFSNFMNEYTSFIENNHIITGEFVGVMIEIDNIYNNQIYNYSYLFTTSNNITKHTFIKKAGHYLCGYHHGSYDKLYDSYLRMLDYAKEHNIKLGKFAYEEYILFDVCEASKDNYLTRITMEIEE